MTIWKPTSVWAARDIPIIPHRSWRTTEAGAGLGYGKSPFGQWSCLLRNQHAQRRPSDALLQERPSGRDEADIDQSFRGHYENQCGWVRSLGLKEMFCFGRDKERRCAHCARVVQDPRSLLFYGSVTDFCDLECQRSFVAEYWVRPAHMQQDVTRKGNECPSTTSTSSVVAIAPTF